VHVPGDYMTAQAAVNALGPTGGTICLGAQAYAENLGIGPYLITTPLVIQGVSSSSTSLVSFNHSGLYAPTNPVVLRGVSMIWARLDGPNTVEGCSFTGSNMVLADGAPTGPSVDIVGGETTMIASQVLRGVDVESRATATIDESDISGGVLATQLHCGIHPK
jgi:hypothetical protein